MSYLKLPWSYSGAIITFGVFFFSLNVYIFTTVLSHPYASPWWLVISAIGLVGFIFSLWKARIHQAELVARKQAERTLS
jgi:hypothetical protein